MIGFLPLDLCGASRWWFSWILRMCHCTWRRVDLKGNIASPSHWHGELVENMEVLFVSLALSRIWEVSAFQHGMQIFSNCLEWWKYLKDQFYMNTRLRKESWKHIPVPLVPLNHLIENQILPAQEALQIYLWSFAYEHLAILRRSPLWIFCSAVTGSHPVNLWWVMGSLVQKWDFDGFCWWDGLFLRQQHCQLHCACDWFLQTS